VKGSPSLPAPSASGRGWSQIRDLLPVLSHPGDFAVEDPGCRSILSQPAQDGEKMGNLVLFMHVSLDGFVAGPNGEMDWIHTDQELFDFGAERIYATDRALYGRKTYQMMEGYWSTAADQPNPTKHDIEHSKWYQRVAKVVLSKTLNEASLTNTRVINDNLKDEITRLKQSTDKEILLFGSPTAAHSLMAAGLIDGYWLFVNPVLLGKGIPLFKEIKNKTALILVASHVFPSGVVCFNYSQKRDTDG
jgi:dihydrofolate reductase